MDERALPRAGDAGDGRHHGQGEPDVDLLEIVLRRLVHGQPSGRASPRRGDGDAFFPAQVLGREGIRRRQDPGERPLGHFESPAFARAGPEVQDVVGGPDRLLVVLHDDDGIPGVTQALEHGDQAAVVPLMEPDRRFVQDIEDASQPGPDLGGQPDPLGLPARERDRRPAELEVGHPQPVHDLEAVADLLDDLPGHLVQGRRKGEGRGFLPQAADGQVGELADVPALDPDHQALLLEPGAAAKRAGVRGQFDLPPFVRGGPEAQAMAFGAGPVGTVEGEVPGFGLGEADLAVRAAKLQRKIALPPGAVDDEDPALGDVDGLGDGLGQPASGDLGDPDLVDEDLDRVFPGLFQGNGIVQVAHLAVDADAEEAFLPQALEEPVILPLAPFDHGGQDPDGLPAERGEDPRKDLVGALGARPPSRSRGSAASRPGRKGGGGGRRPP